MVMGGRWVQRATRRSVLATSVTAALLAAALTADAQDVGLGRAGEEFFSQCDVFGDCSGEICGQPFVYSGSFGGGVITLTDLDITATVTSTNDLKAVRVARILSAYCGSSRGDGLLVSGGTIATQAEQFQIVARAMVKQPPASYQAGGVGELGTDTRGASIPLSYARRLSSTTFVNGSGTLSFAHREMLNQVSFAGAPSYGMRVGNLTNDSPRLAAGAYLPLSFAMSSVEGVDRTAIAWGAGVGGIFVATASYKGTDLSGGITGLARSTNAGVAVPISLFTRGQRPLTPLVDGFVTVGYTNDFTGKASDFAILGAGAAIGAWEFGYKGYLLNDIYTADSVGFSYREEPQGAHAIAEPMAEPAVAPLPVPPPPGHAGPDASAGPEPAIAPVTAEGGIDAAPDVGTPLGDADAMDGDAGEKGAPSSAAPDVGDAGVEKTDTPGADASTD